MKHMVLWLLIGLLLCGCGSPSDPVETMISATEPKLQLANPWKDYTSLEAAEAACGLDFPLNDVVADSYHAETYRVMNGELLEVTYKDGIFEVTVRMQAGEGQDLSGVYAEFENVSTTETETYTITNKQIKSVGIVQLVSKDGYSYSFYAPNHYFGDSNVDFLKFLNQ